MNKKIVHLIIACLSLIVLAGCDGWVQDRRYPLYDGSTNLEPTNAEVTTQTQDAATQTQEVPDANSSEQGGQTTDADTPETQIVETQQQEVISFDLPEGWSRGEDNSPSRAFWWHETADGVKPYVGIEVYIEKAGTKAEAQQYALQDNIQRLQGCREDLCAFIPGYVERNIGGVDVFISTDTSTYWGAESYGSEIYFEKGGHIYNVILTDLVENHTDAITTVIQTIHLAGI